MQSTLAIPSSDMRAKAPASLVFFKCVPPQNSTLYCLLLSAEGLASSSSTGLPMDTTLTGSGYTSPKTALSPAQSHRALITDSRDQILNFCRLVACLPVCPEMLHASLNAAQNLPERLLRNQCGLVAAFARFCNHQSGRSDANALQNAKIDAFAVRLLDIWQ